MAKIDWRNKNIQWIIATLLSVLAISISWSIYQEITDDKNNERGIQQNIESGGSGSIHTGEGDINIGSSNQ